MTDGTTTWSYEYNADGLRTKRTNGTTTYEYIYNGSSLVQMTVGNDTLYFAYDSSSPMTVTYNGTVYYYVTNLQGDVIAILDSAGAVVVEYTYDAWGNILSTTGSMANILGAVNPLRYRGYVYDIETGFYYVSSRYYIPQTGRFVNADILVSTGQGMLGNNMFAYCRNNPVSRRDISGTSDEQIFDCTPNLDEDKFDGKASTGSRGPVPTGSSNSGPSITFLGGQMYPNSGGRHGGMLHRAMVDAIKTLFKALGFEVSPNEKRIVYNEQGNYRYPDVIAENGSTTIYIQVGRTTTNGDPIAREARAIADLEKTGYPVLFLPYDD